MAISCHSEQTHQRFVILSDPEGHRRGSRRIRFSNKKDGFFDFVGKYYAFSYFAQNDMILICTSIYEEIATSPLLAAPRNDTVVDSWLHRLACILIRT